jgi:chemotaxis protein methyltransferase CheR
MNDLEFAWVRGFLHSRAGLWLDDDKAYLAEFRLEPLARREGFSSLSSLIAHLADSPANGLHARVLEAMTTNETSFFRDVHPFDVLRGWVLPKLIAERRDERRLVVWSAACSSGQELYSLAMILRDEFAAALADWDVRLIGSDLSSAMVARAREGLYTQLEVNRGLPAVCLLNHFEKQGLDWRLRAEITRRVEFRVLNLLETWTDLPAPDVVLLRNLLIYMTADVRRALLGRIRRFLRPGGILVLGAAESLLGQDEGYERLDFETCSVYRPASCEGTAR